MVRDGASTPLIAISISIETSIVYRRVIKLVDDLDNE
jgi:hypothetical protein